MKQHTNIKISISNSLLKKIEEDVEGKSRSEKVAKCAAKGYQILKERETA